MSETVDRERTLSKGEFAAEIGVSAGRVSQMIAEGKIGQDAMAGSGRTARIRVDVAKHQIAARRDPGQALGNGLGTRVETAAPIAAESLDEAAGIRMPSDSPAIGGDSFDAQFKREKLAEIQRRNRKAAEEEAERRGRFIEAADARTQMTRVAAAMLSSFEGSLQIMATAITSKYGMPQRDVLHLLRSEFRGFRESEAKRFRTEADGLPETVESVLVEEGAAS
ncbi:hypothetical protein VQ042_18080 [Aurantimonas sp. A2-1-M11]|uniref:hypothetical protein n=1 Tax=Aurantimonas sp. A2-1-M11 TaxID=3113712 RepID=UPI002F95C5A0